MLVIGIETSGLAGSVALLCDGVCLEETTLAAPGKRHAQALVYEMREILSRHGHKPQDVTTIAVSKGPGSFTGLRVGLVCAKTFAYAAGCQFFAIDTFRAIAENCPLDLRSVWIIENAQRGELFAERYERNNANEWRSASTIEIVEADDWVRELEPTDAVTGPGLFECDITTSKARFLTDEAILNPKASVIARLGSITSLTSESAMDADFWKAVPFYMRPSAAEEQRDKRLKDAASPRT